jgi:hypothetical protein
MVSVIVLEVEGSDSLVEFKPIFRRIKENMFALDSSPESFNEGIVRCATLTIHRDLNSVAPHGSYPMLPGTVGTLGQINNLRHSMFANNFMQHGRMILSI